MRLRDSRDTSSPIWLSAAHHTREHSSPRRYGQSQGTAGLVWLHAALFPSGGHGQAWQGKAHAKASTLESRRITRSLCTAQGGGLNPQETSEKTSATRDLESWNHPLYTMDAANPNKQQPSDCCLWLFPVTPNACRMAACGDNMAGRMQRVPLTTQRAREVLAERPARG